MSADEVYDAEGADGYTQEEPGEYATQLAEWCRRALIRAGHTPCRWLGQARYIPESGGIVCGCGTVVDAPVVPQGDGSEVGLSGIPRKAADPIGSTLALIDPSQIYTPEQVERHILDTLARLETGALFERECIIKAEAAAGEWNRVYFATIHTSDQTSELKRKAEAEVTCQERGLTEARDEAKMLVSAVKATMHNLRAVLTGYQAVAKSVNAAYQGGGSPGRF